MYTTIWGLAMARNAVKRPVDQSDECQPSDVRIHQQKQIDDFGTTGTIIALTLVARPLLAVFAT
jgi:hypothetical protein